MWMKQRAYFNNDLMRRHGRVQSRLSSIFLIRSQQDNFPQQANPPSRRHYLHWEANSKQFRVETKQQSLDRQTVYDCMVAAIDGLPPYLPTTPYSSFQIQEDIIMVLELPIFNHSPDTHDFLQLEELHLIERSTWSLKQRYQSFTRFLKQEDLYTICWWIKRFGAVGFASLHHQRISLCLFDWSHLPPDSPDEQLNESLISQNYLQEQRDTGVQYSSFQEMQHLNTVIIIYSNLVRRPVKQLLKLLHQFSGDFTLLDNYLETGDQRFRWSAEEDNILYSKRLHKSQVERYRSKEEIAKRMEYLEVRRE